MQGMRWVNDPEDRKKFILNILYAVIPLLAVLLLVSSISSCYNYMTKDNLIHKYVTQSSHMKIVKVLPDKITSIKLSGDKQDWPFKTCQQYDLISTQKADVWVGKNKRGEPGYANGVEIYIIVKETFNLSVRYIDHNEKDTFLYISFVLQ